MIALVIREVLVFRLQYPEVSFILVGYPAVFTKQHAILVLGEECLCGARLTSQLCDHGTNLCVHVGIHIEETTEFLQVVAIPAEVGVDKLCLWMFFEDVML